VTGRRRTPTHGGLPFVLRRTSLQGERLRDGVAEAGSLDFYGLGVDHGRYNISLNIGSRTNGAHGEDRAATALAGMIRHDTAVPLIDFIVFAGDEQADAAIHLAGHLEGVRALRRFHADANRRRIANLYAEFEAGFATALEIFNRHVTEHLIPVQSKIVVTSMPELLKFVDLRSEIAGLRNRIPASDTFAPLVMNSEPLQEGPCDCNCSCDICCGCGCGCGAGTCGLGCGCSCGCCAECSCGCGCCLFT
jgi:hypothetical protein